MKQPETRQRGPKEAPSIYEEATTSGVNAAASGCAEGATASPGVVTAEFGIGAVVRHRYFPFRGVVFDVDPEFANSEEWWEAIPEAIRPSKDQPFYHLLAENEEAAYVAYVSQQNLMPEDGDKVEFSHPALPQLFDRFENGRYVLHKDRAN